MKHQTEYFWQKEAVPDGAKKPMFRAFKK